MSGQYPGAYYSGQQGAAGMPQQPYYGRQQPSMYPQQSMPMQHGYQSQPPMGMGAPSMMGGMPQPGAMAPTPQMQELRRKFDAVDTDGSNSIDTNELVQVLSTPTQRFPENCARMLIRMFSQEGTVSFEQFAYLDGFIESIRESFARCDADRSGTISTAELQQIVQLHQFPVGPQNVHALLRIFKKNPGPDLSYTDFLSLMSYLALARTLFTRWDARRANIISFDLTNFIMQGLWFM